MNREIVGTAEIAERTGVTAQAVSNWAKRHADFPVPLARLAMGTIYDWAEVLAWLMRTGRAEIVVHEYYRRGA